MTQSITQSKLEQNAVVSIGYYNAVLPLITDARIYQENLVGHRYYVQLISKQHETQDNRLVPTRYEVVDAVVVEPTRESIEALIAATDWLKGYSIIDFWPPEDNCPF